MTDPETQQRTTGGMVGKLAGKAKELAGELTNNDDLAREGRLQHAQGDADAEAVAAGREARQADGVAELEQERVETTEELERLETEVEQRRAEEAAEADRVRAEERAAQDAASEAKQAEAAREQEQAKAAQRVEAAQVQEGDAARDALELKQKAQEAEAKAAALDPKE